VLVVALNDAIMESNEVDVENVHEVEVATVLLTTSYAELSSEELAVASAVKAPEGPELNTPVARFASVAIITSLAFVVVAVGEFTTVTDEPLRVEVVFKILEVDTPDHSEISTRQLPAHAVARVVVTRVPDPLEFTPYQISASRFTFEPAALTQVTPAPTIDETVELMGLPR